MSDGGRLIGIPVRVRRKLDRLRKEEHWLLGQKGRPPTDEELAAELGIDLAALAELRCAEKEIVSLDQSVPGSNEERAEDRQWLAWVLERLDERRVSGLPEDALLRPGGTRWERRRLAGSSSRGLDQTLSNYSPIPWTDAGGNLAGG